MSEVTSSRSAGKSKCEYQDADSSKKIHLEDVSLFLSNINYCRNPQWDCHCDGGVGYVTVKEPRRYEGSSHFEVLFEGGCFSVDGQRSFVNDQSQLKYLHLPKNVLKLEMDLNIGYENVIKKVFTDNEKLDFVLKWILENRHRIFGTDPARGPTLLKNMPIDFCCFRGLLTTIFITPYERHDDWIICATKYKGTIYLCAFPTEKKLKRTANMKDHEKLMCSWGYKFEQYLTKSHPKGHPEPPDTPVNENAEYCGVFKSRLNNNFLLYAAELDGVHSNSPNKASIVNGGKYVELKTSRIITTENQDINFCKYKMLKWWAQCCLASVMKLYCGFRDDYGIVQYIRSFYLLDMPSFGEGLWSPSVCFNFANCFLSFVKKVAVKDDPSVVYKFEWKPGSEITYKELHTSSSPEFQILPEWYTSEFEP